MIDRVLPGDRSEDDQSRRYPSTQRSDERYSDDQLVAPAWYGEGIAERVESIYNRPSTACEACTDAPGPLWGLIETNDYSRPNHATLCSDCLDSDDWRDRVRENRRRRPGDSHEAESPADRVPIPAWRAYQMLLKGKVVRWLMDPTANLWVRRFAAPLLLITVFVMLVINSIVVGGVVGGILGTIAVVAHTVERARNDPTGWIRTGYHWRLGIDPWVSVALGALASVGGLWLVLIGLFGIGYLLWLIGIVVVGWWIVPTIVVDGANETVSWRPDRAVWGSTARMAPIVGFLLTSVLLPSLGALASITSGPAIEAIRIMIMAIMIVPGVGYTAFRVARDGRLSGFIHRASEASYSIKDTLTGAFSVTQRPPEEVTQPHVRDPEPGTEEIPVDQDERK